MNETPPLILADQTKGELVAQIEMLSKVILRLRKCGSSQCFLERHEVMQQDARKLKIVEHHSSVYGPGFLVIDETENYQSKG